MSRISTTPFSMSTDVGSASVGWWEIKFTLINGKGLVEASNRLTNELLTMPEHYERLVELMPLDMWPQFARPQFNRNHHTDRNQERLF